MLQLFFSAVSDSSRCRCLLLFLKNHRGEQRKNVTVRKNVNFTLTVKNFVKTIYYCNNVILNRLISRNFFQINRESEFVRFSRWEFGTAETCRVELLTRNDDLVCLGTKFLLLILYSGRDVTSFKSFMKLFDNWAMKNNVWCTTKRALWWAIF